MAKKTSGKAGSGKQEQRLKARELTLRSLERSDNLGQYIMLAGLALVCIMVIGVTDSFLGPFRINGLDSGGQMLDVFSLGKWLVLAITALLLLIIQIFKILAYGHQIIQSPANMPLAILAILAAFSTLASDYPAVALMGVPDIHFGALPLLAILLVFFSAINMHSGDRLEPRLCIALAVITAANLIIGAGEILGVQWQQAPIIGSLIMPANLPADTVVEGNLQSTFNNPNYPSGLFGSLAVFFLALAATAKQRIRIGIYLGLSMVSLAVAVLSLSTSGFATFSLVAPLLLLLFILNKGDQAIRLSAAAAALSLCLAAGWYASAQNPAIYSATAGWVHKFSDAVFQNDAPVYNVATDKDPATTASAENPAPDKFTIELPGETGWDSSRIYLAQKTWELVKARPVLGYGMDTMVYYFPSGSRETIKVLGLNQILTKPHNMYLQLAVGAGIPALLAFLALVGIYIFLAIRETIKNYRGAREIQALPTAILLFVMAFLIQGLVNDLTVGTGLCFFVMLGLGYRLLADQERGPSA